MKSYKRIRKISSGTAWAFASLVLLSALSVESSWGDGAPESFADLLKGGWGFQRLAGPEAEPVGEWQPIEIPGPIKGTGYEAAAFRRLFSVPEDLQGHLIHAEFRGARWNPRVFLNGVLVGKHEGGFEPFECRLDEHLVFGATNELVTICESWTGVFTERDVEIPEKGGNTVIRRLPKDRVLHPIGGRMDLYGIWDEVNVSIARGPVRITDYFIKTSWRDKTFTLEWEVGNLTSEDSVVTVRSEIHAPDGSRVPELSPITYSVPAEATKRLDLRTDWESPHPWSFEDPFLYGLRITLLDEEGERMDSCEGRFGFREIWIEGPDFYLNGAQIHMLAASWWPPSNVFDREKIRERWQALRDGNVNTFRTHTQPWPNVYYEVADEVGLLMIPEGAIWNDDSAYRVEDRVFWENYAAHLRGMVRHLRNHPSIIMWSLENEFYGPNLNDKTEWPKVQLVRMADVVRELDPTRPITYESDGDPGGAGDVIGVHYMHEFPDFVAWPNETDWIERPVKCTHMFLNGEEEFLWRRKKPLYVGEFLWIPSPDPSWHTVFLGDGAYLDYRTGRNLAKAEAWAMQIQAFRRQGVSGISPWSVIEHGKLDESNPTYKACRWAYQPIAAYVREYSTRLFGGDVFRRRLDVHNDTLSKKNLEVVWSLETPGFSHSDQYKVRLHPGGHKSGQISAKLPPVSERTPLDFVVRIEVDGETVSEERQAYALYPRDLPGLPEIQGVAVFDPSGKGRELLGQLGVSAAPIQSIDDELKDYRILVVGPGALQTETEIPVLGVDRSKHGSLVDYVRAGLRVLLLEQEEMPLREVPVMLEEHASTLTFPVVTDHPALAGLEKEDWRFWADDHFVSRREVSRPFTGNFRPLVVSGGKDGIGRAVLGEWPVGKGTLLFCQALVTEKADCEPVAALLLRNMLSYLDGFEPGFRPAAVHAQSEELRDHLNRLGVQALDITGNLGNEALSGIGTLLYQGPVSPLIRDAESALEFVEAGGTLWLHGLERSDFRKLEPLFGQEIQVQDYQGPVGKADGEHPLLDAFTREDLYWLGEHVGPSHYETPRANQMAFSVVSSPLDSSYDVYEAETGEVQGAIVYVHDTEVALASFGSISLPVTIESKGDYVIGVTARGTSLEDVWPLADVRVDGIRIGTVSVESEDYGTYTCRGRVSQGEHTLKLIFINDAYEAGVGDRNLYVDRVLVAPEDSTPWTVLTNPPALVSLPRGRGGMLIDQVRWAETETNRIKADRFASGLLTALGVEMRVEPTLVIKGETMVPDPEMPYFRTTAAGASLGCNGGVETEFRCEEENEYDLEIVAAGSSVAGVYPIVEISMDGEVLGTVELDSSQWKSYPLGAPISKGVHTLRLAFINDANEPPEDRNLQLNRVVLRRAGTQED